MQLSVLTGTWQMSEISDSVKTLAKNGRNECNREFLAKSENAPVLLLEVALQLRPTMWKVDWQSVERATVQPPLALRSTRCRDTNAQ